MKGFTKGKGKGKKFIPTLTKPHSALTKKDMEKLPKEVIIKNGIKTTKWKAKTQEGNNITFIKNDRAKQSLDEVESVCGLCNEKLIMPNDDVEHEGVEDCHLDCFENTYGAYDSYEDWLSTESKKRGITEKEMQSIVDHEHGYDKDDRKKFTIEDFRNNEAHNNHTENAVELVEMFGTDAEIKEIHGIHERHGDSGISDKDYKRRYELSEKYAKKLLANPKHN